MPAYLIAEITVIDPQGYESYRSKVGESLKKFGAKFLVRGGSIHALEGNWTPERIVMCEFPNTQTAQEWYESDDYKEVKALRDTTARMNIICIEGI